MTAKPQSGGEGKRSTGRVPKRMGSIVNQLMIRRGYGQVLANEQLQQLVDSVIGEALQGTTRVGQVRRGKLELFVSDSVSMQELTFQKKKIIRAIQTALPNLGLKDIRLRIRS